MNQLKKSLFFLLLGVYYLKTGIYDTSKQELKTILVDIEKEIFDVDLQCLSGQELEDIYSKIISYTSNIISNY